MTETAPLDTIRHVATPEGCEISMSLAGPVIRARAWFFDLLLRLMIWLVLIVVIGILGAGFGRGILLVSSFLLEWFYPMLFEVYMQGQTPGKRICKLVVLHDDGRPIGWGASFIRNTLRFVDFFPALYAAGFMTILLNRDGKRLGDLAAGTVVAYKNGEPARSNLADSREKGVEMPPFPLNVQEQQAVIEFSRRVNKLTDERAEELARVATPLTEGLSPEQGKLRLLRIANFLLGAR